MVLISLVLISSPFIAFIALSKPIERRLKKLNPRLVKSNRG